MVFHDNTHTVVRVCVCVCARAYNLHLNFAQLKNCEGALFG
jgi:hypothetical protein